MRCDNLFFKQSGISKYVLLACFGLFAAMTIDAQPYIGCDSTGYLGEIDFSNDPDGTVTFLAADPRDADCCTLDNCVHVQVTIGNQTVALSIDILGAPGIGSFDWQLYNANDNCTSSEFYEVGDQVCVSAAGTYYIAVCKPGSNDYDLVISSVPAVTGPPTDSVRVSCSVEAEVLGLDDGSITWTSISPGVPGQYDGYLDCLTCPQITLTPDANAPDILTYEVCGTVTEISDCGIISYDTCHQVDFYIFDSLTIDVPVTPPGFCANNPVDSIRLDAIVSGGLPPYTYEWYNSNNDLLGTGDHIYTSETGVYQVVVDDVLDCDDDAFELIVVAVYDTLLLDIFADTYGTFNISCFGADDGRIVPVITEGTPGYTFDWNGPNGFTSSDSIVSGLAPGLYTLSVTDGNGCEYTRSITLTEPDELLCSIVQDSPAECNGEANGSATVTTTGGHGSYTFLWDNGETNATAVALDAGTHSVTVTDGEGCTTSCNIVIAEPDALSCTAVQISPVECNGESNAVATVTPQGGNGSYTYLWDNGETTATATGLDVGSNSVTITDSLGCETTCSVLISEPAILSCTAIEDVPVACNGGSNGGATVTPQGGNGGYTYLWDSGETTASAVNLNAGTHSVVVTDSKGCSTTCDVVINEPPVLTCSAIQDNPVECNGESNGEATVSPVGGNGGYLYSWDNGETTATAVGLSAGTHTVTVTDSKGCITSCDVTITEPDVLTCTASQDNPVECNGESNGVATVAPQGGNGGYTYLWDNGEITATATGLNAGLHTVTVTDSKGCTTSCDVTISEPTVLTCSAIQDSPVECNGESNGVATVTPQGGNGGYTYLWDNGESTATAVGLDAGLHSVTVTDSKGCTTSCDVTIAEPTLLTCSAVQDSPVECNGESNGIATVTPQGGNGGYTYLWDSGETTATATGLNVGSHTVIVTDSKGCTTTCSVLIMQPQELTCSASQDNPVECNGESNGEATVIPQGGNGGYTYLWDNGETTSTAIGLNAGVHSVSVTDSKGCITSCSVTITEPVVLSCTASQISAATCNGNGDGQAIVVPAGGNGGYTYLWDNGETTATATNLIAGTHFVTVTDSKGCTTSCTVEITQPSTLSCMASQDSPVECNGESNGVATVSPTGGNGGYSYLWDNGETTATATGLNAGPHNVVVTDNLGCSSSCVVTIDQPDVLTCSAVQDNPVECNGESNGGATVSPAGGNGGYTYLWDNGETTASATGLDAGLHSVTVTDNKGCTTSCSVIISEPAILTCSAVQDSPVECNGESNGAATVTPQGGNGGYVYLWDNGETTASATNLDAGLHSVSVTDSKGCITSCTVLITEPPILTCSAVQDNPVECNGESNGEATVNPQGGNGGYTYLWDNGETTATATGLNAGLHTVTVTDSKGCTTSCDVTITEPVLLTCSAVQDSPVDCNGESNGDATVSPAGGNGGYTYLWDNGETTATATGLNAGLHSVTVTDSKGCTTSCDVTITEPTVLTCSAAQDSPVECNGEANGVATVTPQGGNGGYTYLWDNGETTATAVGLNAGLHSVTVTDSKGCSTSCDVTITEPTLLTCTAIQDSPVECNGESNGNATVTAQGGNGGYTYLWDNGEITATATNLDAGSHSVTVTDSKGCTTTCNVTLSEPDVLTCSAIQNNPVECNGESNGSATVTPQGGNGGYTYLWDNGEITATATGLDAGSHSVTVTDSKGCTTICNVSISEPQELTCTATENNPASCNGATDGAATVTPAGGNGGYTYLWDNGETSATATALDAGIHNVTVTDSKGCITSCSVIIGQPSTLTCTAAQDSPVECNGESNGVATVTPAGGNGGNTYLWENGETTPTATGLNAGTHSVTVTDNLGCETVCFVTISEPEILTCSAVQDSPVECNGEANGVATVTPQGGNGGYTYLWDNGETTATAVGLNGGLHSVTVTDSKGCSTSCDVNIAEPTLLTCTAIQDSPVECNGESNGNATVTPQGGNGGYTYLWDNGETTSTATGLDAGSHSVTVTDSKGCTTTCNVTLSEPDVLTCSVIQNNPVECNGESNGSATVTPQGGNGGYTYLWDNGETTATATGLDAGSHSVTVTDSKGCTTTCSVTITEPVILECTASEDSPASCNGVTDGSATVTASGGNGGYTYLWDNGETTPTAIGLSAGSHSVTVTDTKGCTTSCDVTVTEPTTLTCTANQDSPVECNGESNGAATVTPTGGNGGYIYQWDNGETTATAIALDAGSHSVTVIDSKGCTTTCSVDIFEPEVLTCSATLDSPVECNGESNGIATVTPQGGNGGYTYIWDNGETTPTAVALDAGVHSVTVTDSKGCTTSCTVTMTEPELLTLSEIHTDVLCNDDAGTSDDGTIDLTVSGGTPPYSYDWSNSASTEDLSSLESGTYSVTVTDVNQCTASLSVTLTQPDRLIVTETHINMTCNENSYEGYNPDGSIDATVVGGTPPYSYQWSNGETTEDIDGLLVGTYVLVVTDSNDCTSEIEVEITQPEILVITETHTDLTCNDGNGTSDDGSIDITVTGGTPPYTYQWMSGETTEDLSGLAEGFYSITVVDANECFAELMLVIIQPPVLELALESISEFECGNVSCFGATDGSINITANGGTPPYTFEWSNGSTEEDLTDVGAGNYTVTVTDANDCQSSLSAEIIEPVELVLTSDVVQPTCVTLNNGSIDISVAGGCEPYTFLWSNGEVTEDLDDIGEGQYSVVVSDAGGCTASLEFTITEPPLVPGFLNITGDPITCFGGEIELEITPFGGGDIQWFFNGDSIPGAIDPTLTTSEPGEYYAQVINYDECVDLTPPAPIEVTINDNPDPEIDQSAIQVCPSSGVVTLSTEDGFAGYEWYYEGVVISDAVTNEIFVSEEGEYVVIVTSQDECTGYDTIDVALSFVDVVTDTVYLDLVNTTEGVICLDDDVLDIFGDIDAVSICQEPLFVDYTYDIDGATICFDISLIDGRFGQDEIMGGDTICVDVCDDSGCPVCDRTIIIISLKDDEPPVATEECVEVEENGEIVIDVLANDTDPDGDELYVSNILEGPNHGNAVISADGSEILYIPANEYCGRDTFFYEVCDIENNGCDTTFVCVEVLCECIIPDVITPNGDGINDVFIVECLYQISGGVLQVYNRWGNEVFRSESYNNDWRGTYKDKELPEGTYFFIINFEDHDGNVIDRSGHLTIIR